ncbi:ATP-binding cassette domain-containing protein [Paenibacillus albicereus]|uniref:ATP-binding cassette domain-containing protein n=1 Tax=Paenibacillus albicereus TaxID=2726185 RepID=A0A6H2GVH4_9BACL|nr:ATP-binding cassette domain-containing protein [Paenibacillus albicereus]QJC51166.1 ATP-binding cassette domain-containing protein [Paenibacillus albicereus]
MHAAIEVDRLEKIFPYYKKEVGFRQSVRNLIRRERLLRHAVRGISFSIEEGEMVGFLGPNGAGKTTTLKMLSGILHPTSGTARVLGHTPWERKKAFKQQFAIVMGQKSQLWPDLPAGESIYLNKCIYGVDDGDYRRTLGELSEMLDVQELLGVQVRRLSLGERMKMELIASLIHRPRLIYLDEPTIGLDLMSQRSVRRFLGEYNAAHRATVILTSHYMKDIEDLCPRVVLIRDGGLHYDGSLKGVAAVIRERKLVKLHFDREVSREELAAYGSVQEHAGLYAALEVDKPEVRAVSSQLLDRFPVVDFTIEDLSVEDELIRMMGRDPA